MAHNEKTSIRHSGVKMKVNNTYYIAAIVVLVLVIGYLLVQSNQNSSEAASQQSVSDVVKSIYELRFESPAEILRVDQANGLYKVVVRFTDQTGAQQTQDVYLTRDGKLLTTSLLLTDNYRLFLSAEKGLIECMQTKGLRIFGKTDDTATIQQMQALGDYSYKLFVPCDGANEATCNGLGITRYPTAVYNNTGYSNSYTAQFFSELTGCGVQQ